jgi:hypothetical protein
MDRVQHEIDAHLLAVVDRHDEIPRIRDAMAMDLARRATTGGAVISAGDFFRDHRLDATPMNDWACLRANAHREVDTYLRLHGYHQDLDVRLSAAAETLREWPAATPMQAISGESGQGKSWRAFAMAVHARTQRELLVALDAAGDADTTLNRAAQAVWRQVAGHDEAIPLHRIRDSNARVGCGLFTRRQAYISRFRTTGCSTGLSPQLLSMTLTEDGSRSANWVKGFTAFLAIKPRSVVDILASCRWIAGYSVRA